jgi:aspartate/methionine/tyrosine aminotransferase
MTKTAPDEPLHVGWRIGWLSGGAVVVIAAALILTLIGLGRRITGQAREVDALLERVRDNTAGLFDLPKTNRTIETIAEGLRDLRDGAR